MRARGLASLAVAATLALVACSSGSSTPNPSTATAGKAPGGSAFEFGVIGDYPYTPDQVPQFDLLLDAINAEKPALVLHVGDVGAQPCTDAALNNSLGALNRLTMPVVYTPGDNEWTDC